MRGFLEALSDYTLGLVMALVNEQMAAHLYRPRSSRALATR